MRQHLVTQLRHLEFYLSHQLVLVFEVHLQLLSTAVVAQLLGDEGLDTLDTHALTLKLDLLEHLLHLQVFMDDVELFVLLLDLGVQVVFLPDAA